MTKVEAARILENSQIVSADFTQEALTAAYIEALACLYNAVNLEAENATLRMAQLNGLSSTTIFGAKKNK